MMFDKLIWQKDRILFNNMVFRLEDYKDSSWELGEECFRFYKSRRLMDQYVTFWRARADFRPRKILELGMLDGGSLVLWFEHFQPEKIVGIDLNKRTDSRYFQRYAADRGRAGRIET